MDTSFTDTDFTDTDAPHSDLVGASCNHTTRLRLGDGSDLSLLPCSSQEGVAVAVPRRSLDTLQRFQSPLGKLPHNVGSANLKDPALIAHGEQLGAPGEDGVMLATAHAGCADANLRYLLGHYCCHAFTQADTYITGGLEKPRAGTPRAPLEEAALSALTGWEEGFVARFQELSGAERMVVLTLTGKRITPEWETAGRDLREVPMSV